MRIINVIGYEGLYAVTDNGDVYNLKKGIKLSPHVNKYGYKRICLHKDGIGKTHSIHKIVFMSFKGRIIDNLVIDHIDGDKLNNNIDNLRQISNRDNSSRGQKPKFDRGVTFFKKINKFGCNIQINKIRYFLGTFDTEKGASEAYKKALYNWTHDNILPYKRDKSVKLCKKCGIEKDISEFYNIKGHGVSYMCKQCHKDYQKKRRQSL